MPARSRSLSECVYAGVPGLRPVAIPAHNEAGHIAAGHIEETVRALSGALVREGIRYLVGQRANATEAIQSKIAPARTKSLKSTAVGDSPSCFWSTRYL